MNAAVQSTIANPSASVYAALNAARGGTARGTIEAGQDRFLRLLVTQLRNQDPLNPLDNAQMTSQLAQISMVDGLERLNATLKMILEGSDENRILQAAALVGHGVLVPGNGLTLSGGAAVGGVELEAPAERVSVRILDAAGTVVRTLELGALPAGSRAFVWDGRSEAGTPAADGGYRIEVAAHRGGEKVAARALQMGVVSGVARVGEGLRLNVGELGAFKMSDVREIL